MDLTLTNEQSALRDAVRELFEDTLPSSRLAQLAEAEEGWDPAGWSTMAQMGLLGLSVPVEFGGSGAGLLEEFLVFEQAGAALLPGPLFSTVALSMPALLASPYAAELVPQVVSGSRRVAFAWIDPGQSPHLSRAATATMPADLDDDNATAVLNGSKLWVMDAESVNSLVVAARTVRGAGLFLIELQAAGITIEAAHGMDATRRLSTLTLENVPAQSLVEPSKSWPVFGQIWRRGVLLAVAEAVGASSRVLDISAQYATSREQFGRPIGSYQGVSHQVADLYMHNELARSLGYWAALEGDAGTNSVDIAVAAAASFALPAAVAAAETAIQLHGGIGMTWESILHRYLKRALQMNALDSPAEFQRHQIARVLLDR